MLGRFGDILLLIGLMYAEHPLLTLLPPIKSFVRQRRCAWLRAVADEYVVRPLPPNLERVVHGRCIEMTTVWTCLLRLRLLAPLGGQCLLPIRLGDLISAHWTRPKLLQLMYYSRGLTSSWVTRVDGNGYSSILLPGLCARAALVCTDMVGLVPHRSATHAG